MIAAECEEAEADPSALLSELVERPRPSPDQVLVADLPWTYWDLVDGLWGTGSA